MSPREAVRQAIGDCLRQIRKADGYHTDAGLDVDLDPLPRIEGGGRAFVTVVWARLARPAAAAVSSSHRETTFDIIAKVRVESDCVQTALDEITDDIERAMTDQHRRFAVGSLVPQFVQAEPLVGAFGAGWTGVAITYMSNIPIR